MHFGGLPVKVVQDLLCVFSHALTGVYLYVTLTKLYSSDLSIDQITSQTSTFFYTQDECAKFIKILKLARDNSFDGHQVCVVGEHSHIHQFIRNRCRLVREAIGELLLQTIVSYGK